MTGILLWAGGGLVVSLGLLALLGRHLARRSMRPVTPERLPEVIDWASTYFLDGTVLFISGSKGKAKWPFLQLQARDLGDRLTFVLGLPRLTYDDGEFDVMYDHLAGRGLIPRVQNGDGNVEEFVEFDLGPDPDIIADHLVGLLRVVTADGEPGPYSLTQGELKYKEYIDYLKRERRKDTKWPN